MKYLSFLLVFLIIVFTLSGCENRILENKETSQFVTDNLVIESKLNDSLLKNVEYYIEIEDRSYKNEYEQTLIEHTYELITLKGENKNIETINNALKEDMESFFLSESELEEYADSPWLEPGSSPYFSTCECEVTHNKDGFICIKFHTEWMMGGVHNDSCYALTYNLNTALPATLVELTGRNPQSLEKQLKDITWETINEIYAKSDSLHEDAYSNLQNYKLDEFMYYLDNGEIFLTFSTDTFALGVTSSVTIPTNIFVINN